jgi:hypothetical protein
MTSLVIIAGRFVLGLPVLPLEGSGALTGFTGAAVCAQDAARTMAAGGEGGVASTSSDNHNLAMWGNFIALSASFGTAAYLLIAKKLRPKMDLFVFMFSIMTCGSIFLLIFMLINGEEISFGMHPSHGLFGWMSPAADRLPLEMYMVIVCNVIGTYAIRMNLFVDIYKRDDVLSLPFPHSYLPPLIAIIRYYWLYSSNEVF